MMCGFPVAGDLYFLLQKTSEDNTFDEARLMVAAAIILVLGLVVHSLLLHGCLTRRRAFFLPWLAVTFPLIFGLTGAFFFFLYKVIFKKYDESVSDEWVWIAVTLAAVCTSTCLLS